MPTISQLPLATDIDDTDVIPLSQGNVSRGVPVATLLAGTQDQLVLPRGALLGRVSNGPGGPEPVAIGTGLQILDDVLVVDHSAYPQIGALQTSSNVLLNDATGTPQLLPISLLRGLYKPGQNVSIDPDGTIHSTPAPATGQSIGAVAVGNALVINASGQLSVNVGTVSGTVAAGDDARIVNAEETTNKNVAGGYAGLDANGKILQSALPPVTQSLAGADASQTVVTTALANAVPRSTAVHFADVVNINDFGLARNGTTDDSAKFVAACQTAMKGNLKLYIPSGGPILLTDAAQQRLTNISIFGDGIRDYASANGYGHVGSCLWFTGTTKSPFQIGPNVQFQGLNFFWPNQTETATANNGNQPIAYPPLFSQTSPASNITYFRVVDCQVTNCYDFFTADNPAAVVGACSFERNIIYAIRNCFTLINVPEIVFMANNLFTWGVYGSVVSVGPTYNLRTFTNQQGCWLKVLGNGTTSAISTTTVGGIQSVNNYVYGANRGVWLAAGTLDIASFVNTGFDTVPFTLVGDPGCAFFSSRFIGGQWYPIFLSNTADSTAIQINSPAPGGVGSNLSFSGITVPFVNGSFCQIAGANISGLSFSDIRCNNLGHTSGGAGPYYGFTLNTPNAVLRVASCDLAPSAAGLANTGVQILACATATLAGNVLRNFAQPIDVETTTGQVVLSNNLTVATQGATTVSGTGGANVRDLFNSWDKPNYAYNGYAAAAYRPGATLGIQAVASSAAASYVGVMPSAAGTIGGTRLGLSAVGISPVSLLTNGFAEEQLRVNRLAGSVNYLAMRGALSGTPAQISVAGADAAASLQLCGSANAATYIGSSGAGGSPVVHLGAIADQSYVGIAPGSGFGFSVPVNCSTVLIKPAATLATGSITLPTPVADGQRVDIWSSRAITSLSVNSATGTVNGGAGIQLNANAAIGFIWNAPNATWFQRSGGGSANGTIAGQDASNVAITGGTITGLSQFAVGTDNAASATITLDSAPGYGRVVVYASASSPRWVVGAQGTPENNASSTTTQAASAGATALSLASTAGFATGMLVAGPGIAAATTIAAVGGGGITLSTATTAATPNGATITGYTNQGSDFAILPYDDTGAPLAPTLGQPLVITRATGQVTIRTLAVAGSANAPTPPAGDASTSVATTAFVANAITARGGAGGFATLDGTGRVPASQLPAAVQGALNYQGTWNAATNTPSLASGTGTKGFYYTVATAGSTALDGIGQWNAGDHAAYNGTAWEKLDGLASEVISVAGRTGAVSLAAGDIAGLGSIAAQSSAAVAITGGNIQNLSLLSVGSSAGPTVSSFINGAAGGGRQLVFQTASTTRWNVSARGDAEANVTLTTTAASSASTTLTFASTTGAAVGQLVSASGVSAGTTITALSATTLTLSAAATVASGASVFCYANAGSSFAVQSYDDTGALLATPLSIARASGALTILGTIATTASAPIVFQGGGGITGNARGTGAFDAQITRSGVAQVASGTAAALFGASNTAAGSYSFAAGSTNTIAGSYSHAFGLQGRDFGRTGAAILASGANTTAGDAQRHETTLRATTTTTTAIRMTTDGAAASSANTLNLQANQAAKITVEIIGFAAATPAAASWIARDIILLRGATAASTTLSSTTLTAAGTAGSTSGWTAPTIAADTTLGALAITSGSAGATVKWMARVVALEVM